MQLNIYHDPAAMQDFLLPLLKLVGDLHYPEYHQKTNIMANEKDDKKPIGNEEKNTVQPDPETLNTTDPQEEMEGPISSIVQGLKDGFENKDKSKEEADKEKEEDL